MDTQIKDRAYALWEAAGRPEGQDEHFWFAAAAELAQADAPQPTAEPEPTAKPTKAKARAPRAKKAA
ncbi:MAG: hypothetical protein JWR39_530 [Devosia sp.]|jgi:hypothetical protein|nr:hypothetical protein [Devosia sp.]